MRAHVIVPILFAITSCGPGPRTDDTGGDDDAVGDAAPPPCPRCSDDRTEVIDCEGNHTPCPSDQACSVATATCTDACLAAEMNHSSVGCEYYAVDMDAAQ